MGCCGQSRNATGLPATNGRHVRPVLFEHRGHGPLIVHGRVTGIRYHFPGPGARLSVDARDAPFLEIIRGLEIVSPAT